VLLSIFGDQVLEEGDGTRKIFSHDRLLHDKLGGVREGEQGEGGTGHAGRESGMRGLTGGMEGMGGMEGGGDGGDGRREERGHTSSSFSLNGPTPSPEVQLSCAILIFAAGNRDMYFFRFCSRLSRRATRVLGEGEGGGEEQ
jgi:hypothetical protein